MVYMLPVSPSMHSSQGCTWSWGCVPGPRGVPGPGGVPAQVLSPLVNRMTDRCKNITLPQTPFAGGENSITWIQSGKIGFGLVPFESSQTQCPVHWRKIE